jgi:hypothetical protein
MSDAPPEFTPPPPPPGTPPPAFQAPPGYAMPPNYQPPAATYAPPAGYVPPSAGYSSATYAAVGGIGLMSQFGGRALWSIILGLISVGVPIATGLTTGGTFTFFYVLPIFGAVRGLQAIARGQVIGGIVGIALNMIGGLISLWASGLLFG